MELMGLLSVLEEAGEGAIAQKGGRCRQGHPQTAKHCIGSAPHPVQPAPPPTSWKRPWLAEMKNVSFGKRCAIQWCPLAVSRYLVQGQQGEGREQGWAACS